jgi:antirestriction protein ArdC
MNPKAGHGNGGVLFSSRGSCLYLQSWLNVLQEDPKLIIHASAKAQKAVEYILCKHEGKDGVPELDAIFSVSQAGR